MYTKNLAPISATAQASTAPQAVSRSRCYGHRRQPPGPPDYRNPAYRLYTEEHIDQLKEIVGPKGQVLKVKSRHRAVLKQHVRYQKQTGECYAGHATIGEQVGLSRRTVLDACGDLRDHGVLNVQRRGRRLKNGKGGRTTNLTTINWDHSCWTDCRPKPSFRKGPEASCDARLSAKFAQRNLSASSKRDSVKSEETSQPTESVTGSTTKPETPVDTEKTPLKETPRPTPVWTPAILGALILRLIGVQLGIVSLGWIVRTISKRKLNAFEPECVVRAIADDLNSRNSFAAARPDLFRDPGAVIHAAAKRIEPDQVPEKIHFSGTIEYLLASSTNAEKRATETSKISDFYSELRRRHEKRQPDPPVARTIDHEKADEILSERGLNLPDLLAWVWDHPPRPLWPVTPDELEAMIERYRRSVTGTGNIEPDQRGDA
jgi:biotin operon repressor